MKSLNCSVEFVISWWPVGGGKVAPQHEETLKVLGYEHAHSQFSDGMREGELNTTLDTRRGRDITYRGYFKVIEKDSP